MISKGSFSAYQLTFSINYWLIMKFWKRREMSWGFIVGRPRFLIEPVFILA